MFVVTTPPKIEPVSLAEAKLHCRVDTAICEDDGYLSDLIVAARELVEKRLQRKLITQVVTWTLDEFPDEIPLAPVQSVDEITYFDTDHVEQTLADYQVDTSTTPARLAPAIDDDWPDLSAEKLGKVTITATVGYGDSARDVPARLRMAIRWLVAQWYRDREPLSQVAMKPIPYSVESSILSERWR